MKMRILLSLAVLAMALVPAARAALIHHYTLDANADDSVGATVYKHGYTYGAVYGPGILGGAAVFDGVDDHIDFRFERLVRTTEFTIAAWANHYGPGGGYDNVNVIFSQRRNQTSGSAITLATWSRATQAVPYSAAVVRDSDNNFESVHGPAMPFNEWHHYAMTVGPEFVIYYIDGIEVGRTGNSFTGDFYRGCPIHSWRLRERHGYSGLVLGKIRQKSWTLLKGSSHAGTSVPNREQNRQSENR